MRFLKCFLALTLSVGSSMAASAAAIPSFKVAGSTSATSFFLDFFSNFPTVTIGFDPATLTVDSLIDGGNSGLSLSDTLAFTGGRVSFDYPSWNLNSSQDLPFVYSNLVTFTTSEGSFRYNSEKINVLPNYFPGFGHVIPGLTISDGQTVAYSRGTITGPGGSAPANFMLFVNTFQGQFGNAAWALYSPEVIPYPNNAVPEPSSMAIAALFVGGGALRKWRHKRHA